MAGQFAHKVNKYTISGTSYSGGEIWSTGFYMGSESADAGLPNEAGLGDIDTAWKTFFQSAQVKCGTNWTTTQIKGVQLLTTGVTDDGTQVYRAISPTYNGTGSSMKMPPQVSLCATLTTAVSRGLASKGRMYLPGVSIPIFDDGRISTTDAGYVATQLATFLSACNASTNLPGSVILASKGKKPLYIDGLNRVVTNTRVGNVYDTQRRRRDALVETYQNGNVT